MGRPMRTKNEQKWDRYLAYSKYAITEADKKAKENFKRPAYTTKGVKI